MDKQHKKAIIIISGEFLTDYLPENFDQMTKNQIYAFIDDHISEDFELFNPVDLYRLIKRIASRFELINAS